jgi:hypothetical protein
MTRDPCALNPMQTFSHNSTLTHMPPFQNENTITSVLKVIYASHNRGNTLRLHFVPRGVGYGGVHTGST